MVNNSIIQLCIHIQFGIYKSCNCIFWHIIQLTDEYVGNWDMKQEYGHVCPILFGVQNYIIYIV